MSEILPGSNASTTSTELTNGNTTTNTENTNNNNNLAENSTNENTTSTENNPPENHETFQTQSFDCSALPQGWKRSVRQYQHSSKNIRGRYNTTAYVFKGERYSTKSQLARAFSKITKNENGVDLSSFDWNNGRWIRQHHKQKKGLEQLSVELFGKGITDINFTISQPTELTKKGLPADKKVDLITPHGRLSAVKKTCPRPDDIPDWDFDYDHDQGINGTPIHHPTKKRQKQQIEIVPDHGPLQLYGVRRLSGGLQNCMKPCNQQDKSVIEQPILPPTMNKKVVKENHEVGEAREEVMMDGVLVVVPERPPPDCARIMDDELLWRQTVQSLTIDGKALPSTAIWGQDDNNSDRLARVPDAWIDPTQPMVKKFSISKEVIAEQAGRVRTLRKELSRLHQELKHLENDKVRDELGLPKVEVHGEGEVMVIDD